MKKFLVLAGCILVILMGVGFFVEKQGVDDTLREVKRWQLDVSSTLSNLSKYTILGENRPEDPYYDFCQGLYKSMLEFQMEHLNKNIIEYNNAIKENSFVAFFCGYKPIVLFEMTGEQFKI
jgi:hypothetical protein